ncbi:MAG: PASTA domain-containing protein [Bulleidia sp.]|nr:PASTA domain-containing protein [Bulleidia sp.]
MKLLSNTKALMGIVIALMSAIIVTSVIYITSAPSGIDIPDFSEKTKEDVQTWISDNEVDSNLVTFSYAYDEDKDQDIVLSQSMAAGEKLTKDNILTITLSNGPDPDKEFTLPDFTGKDKKEVSKWFTDNKFSAVTYAFSPDEEVEKDIFLKCSAEKGAKVKRSDKITVTISTGTSEEEAEEITVPDFSTYTKANISAWGTTNNVTIMFRTQTSDTIAEGKFISQSVKAGTKVKKGSGITITLSSGKALSAIDYTGKAKSEAAAWISKEGLKAVYQEYYSDTVAEGYIIDQTPKSGTIQSGGTITFMVSVGKVSIEDYTGKTISEFQAYIGKINAGYNNSAKLTIKTTKKASDKSSGTILSQSTSGTVSIGTAITVEVADDGKSTSTATPVPTAVTIDPALYQAGKSYNDLVNAVSAANKSGGSFNVKTTGTQASDSIKSGNIISCSLSGNTISCIVSSGPAAKPTASASPTTASVPDFTGLTMDQANAKASAAGLKVYQRSSVYDSAASGTIVSQKTAAGTTVALNTTIDVVVSKGPEPTPTPTPTPTPVSTITMPVITDMEYTMAMNRTYDENVSWIISKFKGAGFNENQLNIQKAGTKMTSGESGIESISPDANGQSVKADTVITIVIKDPNSTNN